MGYFIDMFLQCRFLMMGSLCMIMMKAPLVWYERMRWDGILLLWQAFCAII